MILPDTSVWIDHFRRGNSKMTAMLRDNSVLCHAMVIGELACGNLRARIQDELAEVWDILQEP